MGQIVGYNPQLTEGNVLKVPQEITHLDVCETHMVAEMDKPI